MKPCEGEGRSEKGPLLAAVALPVFGQRQQAVEVRGEPLGLVGVGRQCPHLLDELILLLRQEQMLPPVGWMTLIYIAALAALFVYAFWSVDSFTGKVVHTWSFDNFKEIFQSGVLFLAYAYGLPVVATDVGSFGEEIVEGRTGFLCKAGDPAEMARAIETYFGSDLFKNLSVRRQEIKDYANTTHSWHAVADLTCSAYGRMRASHSS